MRKKLITLSLAICAFALVNPTLAQREQNQMVITAGVGYSIGMAIIKGGINLGLTAASLGKASATPVINGMIDYGITENFSIGAAYSFNKFSWTDSYTSTDTTGATIINAGTVDLARHNIGGRALFHFGSSETTDLYAGARLGTSIWKADYSCVSTSGESSASDFSMPAGIFSIQALFGVRTYFNDFIGANFEVGIGTSPYFIGGGLVFKI